MRAPKRKILQRLSNGMVLLDCQHYKVNVGGKKGATVRCIECLQEIQDRCAVSVPADSKVIMKGFIRGDGLRFNR